MPTKLYSRSTVGSVSFAGKSYPVKDGEVEVPDDAVKVLTESHGFSLNPFEDAEKETGPGEGDPLLAMTKKALLDYAEDNKIEVKASMTKEEILAAIQSVAVKAAE